jgi:hypothetical protein
MEILIFINYLYRPYTPTIIVLLMKHNEEIHDEIGDNHISSCATNPLREDAFDITDDEK